ncbi:CLUMA_CG010887, isoform A [Clunio marinus]|uniref:CLUMA_CG010887, isoform A n=1 Tax=Clunio marinus TaxID=568069 RepID=A0A1J1ICL5_9DIPT|nr:CLUMA_CG010887, isoform A [Clunio marinus]
MRVLVLMIIIGMSRLSSSIRTSRCSLGSTYNNDCNICTCIVPGFFNCTQYSCEKNLEYSVSHVRKQRSENPNTNEKSEPPSEIESDILTFQFERCEPKEIKNEHCNRCKCTNNGADSSPVEQPCTTGHSYEQDCNTCTCTETGIYQCTLRACISPDEPRFPDTVAEETTQGIRALRDVGSGKCTQGHSYEQDCNTCTCTETGIYQCTLRACISPDEPRFPDTVAEETTQGIRALRDVSSGKCTQGHSYEQDCNTCTCTETGIYQYSSLVEQPCTTGHSYEQDCNTCTCTETGIYQCTLRACISPDEPRFPDTVAEETTQGIRALRDVSSATARCVDGHSYHDGCNTCVCTNGLYACTLIACID